MAKGYVVVNEELLQDEKIFNSLVDFFGELKQVKELDKIQKEEGLVVFKVEHFRIKYDGDLYNLQFNKQGEIQTFYRETARFNALKAKLKTIEL